VPVPSPPRARHARPHRPPPAPRRSASFYSRSGRACPPLRRRSPPAAGIRSTNFHPAAPKLRCRRNPRPPPHPRRSSVRPRPGQSPPFRQALRLRSGRAGAGPAPAPRRKAPNCRRRRALPRRARRADARLIGRRFGGERVLVMFHAAG
jgi:hypothetical protein